MGVVFPVGDDVEGCLIPYIQKHRPGTASEKIKEIYLEASLGKIKSEEFWQKFDLPLMLEKEYLDRHFTPDEQFMPVARKLAGRYRLALLSNDVSEWSFYLREKHGLNNVVEKAFISGDMGLRKPDPAIYARALEELNIKAYECIFIDDYPERVAAAEKLGIIPILFNRQDFSYSGRQISSFKGLDDLLL